MRFRSSDKPPPLSTRREQRRMLMLIGALAVIVFAVQFAGDANFWRNTGLIENAPPPGIPAEGAADPEGEIDFGVVSDDDSALPPDAFRARPPADDAKSPPASTGDQAAATESPNGENLGISPELLDPIRDNTLGIRREESNAYYALLDRLKQASPRAIEEAALDEVNFRVVMVDSDSYRGKLLTIEGDLRRLLPLGKSSSHPDLGEMYEAWIFTADSETNPWRVVTLGIPEGIPQGERLDPPSRVRVSGYYFKREGYASQGGLHTAPLILARRLKWLPPTAGENPPQTGLAQSVLAAALMVAVCLAFTAWRLTAGSDQLRKRQLKRIAEPQRDDVEGLTRLEAVDPGEMLRRLSEQHRDAETP